MPASEKPTIVFAHGLWADGSCWSEVISRLHTEGFNAIAVQNPLTSLEDDVLAVKRALDRAGDGPVTLVGHSWGGVVITASGSLQFGLAR
jgi:pimeloyl-ACP methyl ester carboxylesterase